MFNKLLGKFSKDLGIDLGTKNTLIYTSDNGIIINEPSIMAINTMTNEILAVGDEAKKMVGKTPAHIKAIQPLQEGIISDFEVAEKMIKYYIDKVYNEHFSLMPRPRVVIGIPLDVTEVEKKSFEDVIKSAGARKVHLVEQSMASAIGTRLPVLEATASMVIDIGGGTTEIAVISLGGVVTWKTMRLAGDELDNNIIQYIREKFNILIGSQIAEEIKIRIGSALSLKDPMEMKVRGRDLISGLPKEVIINTDQAREAMSKTISKIIENIKITLEVTPPELVSDIYEHGIILTGGVAQLRSFDKAIAQETKIPVKVAEDPLTCMVRGTGILLDDDELLNRTESFGTYEL